MRPLLLFLPLFPALAAFCVPTRAAEPPDSPVPYAPSPLSAAPVRALDAWVDSSLADDRRLYWLRCTGATASRRRSRSHALQGMALFLANVPVEYAASRHRHARGSEPVRLNALGFALLSASFLKLGLANLAWQDYQRDRACCRHWQEFAQISR